jgi:cytochrome c peroxidase
METIALGEKLFFSPLLSVDGSVSCATCHNPAKGFADGRAVSIGVAGKKGRRNAPTVRNAAYNTLQFWDGRAESLEAQALGPMLSSIEMAHTLKGIEQRCNDDPELRRMFEAAFGGTPPGQSPVTMARVTHALASYERTLLCANSPFDRYQYGGDKSAMGASAERGLALFRDPQKGNCTACHTIGSHYALFTDNQFHNLGVGMNPEGELTDLGRYLITSREADRGAFRTPSLRNVAETAPYMHDGSLNTLKDVVDFYVGGGNGNPHLDQEIKPLTYLTKQDRADLVAFLEALTGESPQ